jgi:NAD(P)-dependent dehydrogenase (short-subunit alcohol dehydrogenase family)
MTTLQNKTALGRATAAALAEAGAHIIVHYGRSAQEAESLVTEIRTKGGHAEAFSADLGTPDGASLLAGHVRSLVGDRLDVLVLNAGISKAARIEDHTIEDFDNLFATNVRGPFFLVQQLLPVLGEGSGIVVVSSLGARIPFNPHQTGPADSPGVHQQSGLNTLGGHRKTGIRGHFKTGQRSSGSQDKICYALERLIPHFFAGMDIFDARFIFWFTLFGPKRGVGQRRDATRAPTPSQTIPCRG